MDIIALTIMGINENVRSAIWVRARSSAGAINGATPKTQVPPAVGTNGSVILRIVKNQSIIASGRIFLTNDGLSLAANSIRRASSPPNTSSIALNPYTMDPEYKHPSSMPAPVGRSSCCPIAETRSVTATISSIGLSTLISALHCGHNTFLLRLVPPDGCAWMSVIHSNRHSS